jgi:predicted hotdog family 3-hydroxylacyl-ACP dehydratase
MAAKTCTINAEGTTAAQTLDATTTMMMVDGSYNGVLTCEVSREGTRWASVACMDRTRPGSETALAVSIPGGWQVRFNAANGLSAPSLTIDIE